MTSHDPLPYNVALCRMFKDDYHYLQRLAGRINKNEEETLQTVIEKYRHPGGPDKPTDP